MSSDKVFLGEQTRLALDNFQISSLRLPSRFIGALLMIKRAAAETNADLGVLPDEIAAAIAASAAELATDVPMDLFPLDVFQTGSATSTHMNVNEILAKFASDRCKKQVHPNDHVNAGQSSNDVVPTAIHLCTALAIEQTLLPSLTVLQEQLAAKREEIGDIVKTGRTHLMDAMPITFGQELSAWETQLDECAERIISVFPRLCKLALGGTAVGTGINAHPDFSRLACRRLSELSGLKLAPGSNLMTAVACQDTATELSGQLRVLAVALSKIANDLRLMNSGPGAGFGEISLSELQAGSSIMPGKVNPVIPEAVAMVCAQVMGNDLTIAYAAQSGNFQLNTMLPLIAYNLLQSIELLDGACQALAWKAVTGMSVNADRVAAAVATNPILATALNPIIGYELAAIIAKQAAASGQPLIDVAETLCDISRSELERLLDPRRLT